MFEVVTNFIKAGKSLQELVDGMGVALAAGERVFLVNALVSWLDQNLICQGYPVSILVKMIFFFYLRLIPRGLGS